MAPAASSALPLRPGALAESAPSTAGVMGGQLYSGLLEQVEGRREGALYTRTHTHSLDRVVTPADLALPRALTSLVGRAVPFSCHERSDGGTCERGGDWEIGSFC